MTRRRARQADLWLDRIRSQARASDMRVTQHAQQEMAEEHISLDEILEAVSQGRILEEYPHHRRGACCLIYGLSKEGRAIHVVCTTARPTLIIITVYEPALPKWTTPSQRRQST